MLDVIFLFDKDLKFMYNFRKLVFNLPIHLFSRFLCFHFQWNLVCDKSTLGDLAQTILMCGQIPGAVIMTGLSDKYGRRTVHVYCHLLSFVLSFVLAVSPNYAMFATVRFFVGFLIPVSQQPQSTSNLTKPTFS